MGVEFESPSDSTAIDPEEAGALIPALSTQAELNAYEALNIAEAVAWATANKRFLRVLLTDQSLRRLHRQMFGKTWKWAGRYRSTQKSIGVEAFRISTEVRNLVADVDTWLEHRTYSPVEISARFHHRLVLIHPFANGNGRHARLATDLLCERQGWQIPEWGAADLVSVSEIRARYIEALRCADAHDLGPLIAFMEHSVNR